MMQRRGFTLIELLVVIAIISLLVSILLPSLQRAREMAKEAVCLGNMHQWSLTLAMYQNDYEERLPPFGGEWTLRHYEYIPGKEFCACPALREGHGDASYVPNCWMWGTNAYAYLLAGDMRRVETNVDESIVMTEREHVLESQAADGAFTHRPVDGSDVAFLHRGSAVFLFLDSHASWMYETGSDLSAPWLNNDPVDYARFRRHWQVPWPPP